MDVVIEPGKYVVAVSGGVDSMVLLDLLAKNPAIELVVAHFDHGMREDSAKDRWLVHEAAENYGLPFVFAEGQLGAGVSEEKARKARYEFLHGAKKDAGAQAIVTAHHQDDLAETAIINMLRGTGRKGLSSLKSRDDLVRPLLAVPKEDLIKYAKKNKLKWREDSTNQDTRYLRNHVRHKILPKFSENQKKQLIDIVNTSAKLNDQIDELLIGHLHVQPSIDRLDRHWFQMLPHDVALEVTAHWLRRHKVKNLNKKLLEQIVTGVKTLSAGKQINIDALHTLIVEDEELALISLER